MVIGKIYIWLGGALTLFVVIYYSRFYKLYNWKEEFKKLEIRTSKFLFTMYIVLLVLLGILSLLSFFYADELSSCGGISFGICLFLSIFWLLRAIWQLKYLKLKDPTDKKAMLLHYILVFVFVMLFVSYLVPIIIKIA